MNKRIEREDFVLTWTRYFETSETEEPDKQDHKKSQKKKGDNKAILWKLEVWVVILSFLGMLLKWYLIYQVIYNNSNVI